jgi:hypothetical protein
MLKTHENKIVSVFKQHIRHTHRMKISSLILNVTGSLPLIYLGRKSLQYFYMRALGNPNSCGEAQYNCPSGNRTPVLHS